MQANSLANPPFDAIARHGIAERARRCESNSRPLAFGFAEAKSREVRAGVAEALVIDAAKIL